MFNKKNYDTIYESREGHTGSFCRGMLFFLTIVIIIVGFMLMIVSGISKLGSMKEGIENASKVRKVQQPVEGNR
ncbi:MAG: hypothetical protein HQK54_14950 [Oligoflexales bacterium]|nr:hypothetical protein [Oligoflexales bacterium]